MSQKSDGSQFAYANNMPYMGMWSGLFKLRTLFQHGPTHVHPRTGFAHSRFRP